MPPEELQTTSNTTPSLEAPPSMPEGDQGEVNSDIQKLKTALAAERKNSQQYERDYTQMARRFEAVKDIDPDSYKGAIQKAAELEKATDELAEREQARLREQESKYTAQLQEALSQKESALGELKQAQHRYALEKHFIGAEGRTEAGDDGVSAFDMFWDQLGSRFRIDPESGDMGVVDQKGDWVLDNETGRRLAVSAFIEQQKVHPLYSFLFRSKYGSGSGMGQSADVRVGKGSDFQGLSTNQKFAEAFGTV